MENLERLKDATVLVVGDVMLDRYWWGDVTRISPEAPVPVVRLRKSTFALGGAANVAANVAGLGARPILIGCVGTDDEAADFRTALLELGVSAEYLVARDRAPTSVKTRIIAHNQQVVRVDREESTGLSASEENRICDAIATAITDADIIIISDYQKGVLSEAVLAGIFESAGKSEKKIFVDPKGRDFGKYSGASVLTPNRREAAEALDLDEASQTLIETAGRRLIKTLDLEAILITRGDEGMSLFIGANDEIHLHTEAKQIYDVTGAGDTVIATLATAVAAGFDYTEASMLANTAAGIVVGQVGTTAITFEQLVQAVNRGEDELEKSARTS